MFEIKFYIIFCPQVQIFIWNDFMQNRLLFSHYTTASALDSHKQLVVICTDFTKAFDKINHMIQLTKLSGFRFSD